MTRKKQRLGRKLREGLPTELRYQDKHGALEHKHGALESKFDQQNEENTAIRFKIEQLEHKMAKEVHHIMETVRQGGKDFVKNWLNETDHDEGHAAFEDEPHVQPPSGQSLTEVPMVVMEDMGEPPLLAKRISKPSTRFGPKFVKDINEEKGEQELKEGSRFYMMNGFKWLKVVKPGDGRPHELYMQGWPPIGSAQSWPNSHLVS
ncbi:hypothetical protein H6P81_005942 [Aristolochia fimbriata]|uniref:Uncharacterized protein n=1 Tax=Aristolochia fimbriata TaxID=158543 RepID=A0AAV7EW33_ARIFI|nr:hypothetical protein H6P81_005942 [Aristolochia fimbriata]